MNDLIKNLENNDIEHNILGSVIANNDLFYRLCVMIKPIHFANQQNAEVWIAVEALMQSEGKVTHGNLYGKYIALFGDQAKEYSSMLLRNSFGITALSNAKTLVDLYNRRILLEIYQQGIERLADGDIAKSGEDLASETANKIEQLLASSSKDSSSNLQENMNKIYEDLRDGFARSRVSTGLINLDRGMAGGLERGRLYAFSAVSKAGKTLLASTIANHLNDTDVKHLFVCAEMDSMEITSRMLGAKTSKLAGNHMSRVQEAVASTKRNMIFEDEPGIEFDRLKNLVERHVLKNKIQGFILDYYQLVSGCPKGSNQSQHLEEVANWIHRVCKRHNIWSIILVQSNDEGRTFGSRGLERACDQLYMLERQLDDQGHPIGRGAWLVMAKSRYTKRENLGSKSSPSLAISENGTHFEDVIEY